MKVAISGAGIAGPTVAFWLWRNGHEPTLIEKAPQLRTGGYVIDFWGVGYDVAERMGLAADVHAAGYVVGDVRLVDRHGRRVGGFATDGLRRVLNDRFTSLPRGELAAMIYGAIADRVETVFGDSIVAVEQDDGGVQVSFENGRSQEFDLLIGAGGQHCPVRRLAFGEESTFERDLGYRVAAFEARGYRPRDELVYVSYGLPGRMASRFAMRDDRTMFLFICTADQMSDPDPAGTGQAKTVLRNVFGDAGWECPEILSAMDQADDMYFDRVSQIAMDSWSNGRVVLIGDSAAAVSLLAGEGTGLAMLEAYLLAGELDRAGSDYPSAFRRYQQQLRPFIEGKQRSAQHFASAFAPRTWPGVWTRNQLSRLLSMPVISDRIVHRQVRDEFALPARTL